MTPITHPGPSLIVDRRDHQIHVCAQAMSCEVHDPHLIDDLSHALVAGKLCRRCTTPELREQIYIANIHAV